MAVGNGWEGEGENKIAFIAFLGSIEHLQEIGLKATPGIIASRSLSWTANFNSSVHILVLKNVMIVAVELLLIVINNVDRDLVCP